MNQVCGASFILGAVCWELETVALHCVTVLDWILWGIVGRVGLLSVTYSQCGDCQRFGLIVLALIVPLIL